MRGFDWIIFFLAAGSVKLSRRLASCGEGLPQARLCRLPFLLRIEIAHLFLHACSLQRWSPTLWNQTRKSRTNASCMYDRSANELDALQISESNRNIEESFFRIDYVGTAVVRCAYRQRFGVRTDPLSAHRLHSLVSFTCRCALLQETSRVLGTHHGLI